MKRRTRRAWLSESAAAEIVRASKAAHPHETGGVLLGVVAGHRQPWITRAIELPSPVATARFYEVPRGVGPEAVGDAQRDDPRIGYLGEWHAHPLDVPPSATDVETMQRLAADPGTGCAHPVLIVARRSDTGYRLDGRQLARRRLVRMELVAAGGLLEAAEGERPDCGEAREVGSSDAR